MKLRLRPLNERSTAAEIKAVLSSMLDGGISLEYVLRVSCGMGLVNVVRVLLGMDINVHGLQEDALYRASGCGHVEVVRLLLQSGAKVNTTALEIARVNGYVDVVQLLESSVI